MREKREKEKKEERENIYRGREERKRRGFVV